MTSTSSHRKTFRILIVEDDEMMQALLTGYLKHEGYEVDSTLSGKEMHAILNRRLPDLILLDLNLPDEDGLVLARQIRARSKMPLIIMTARRGVDDRLAGLQIGADDYLTKPFDPRELVLRVHNVLARTAGGGEEASLVLEFGGWTQDLPAHTLTAPDGRDISLTKSEFNLLAAMAKFPGRVLSRDFLLDAVSGNSEPPSDRMIDVFVSRLRKKIETDSRKPELILTVPGLGYKLAGNLS
ncbi:MAG: response regulator transcription factor [Alphaproteobacteria bacterium]|nr:response regulator transcription factor [Alphaproteobacteria bacterium]